MFTYFFSITWKLYWQIQIFCFSVHKLELWESISPFLHDLPIFNNKILKFVNQKFFMFLVEVAERERERERERDKFQNSALMYDLFEAEHSNLLRNNWKKIIT